MDDRLLLGYNLQFFAKDGPGGEKTEPATAKKLNDVRKEGQVAKSKDLVTALMLMSAFLIIKIYAQTIGSRTIEIFQLIYNDFKTVVDESMQGMPSGQVKAVIEECITKMMVIMVPIIIVAFIISFFGNVLQQKWMITSKPLKPKLSRISPLNGFKRMFSARQVVELVKSIAMISVIGVMAYLTIKEQLNILYTFYDISLNAALVAVGNVIVNLGIKISALYLIIGFADLFYQRHKFKNDNMMTKQEVKDEFKDQEGDPQVKGQIRRKMQEISRRRMMQQLPEADVVITNPTHFAVALKYEPNSGKAPVVIAKGADYLAMQIKEKARECNIEIVENKPLARILYNNIDIGMEIPPELYQAVAEILARVLQADGKTM